MRGRITSALATALAAAALILAGASLFGVGFGDANLIDADVLFVPAIAALSVVGGLIARSQPRNAIGWLFIAMGLIGSLGTAADAWFQADLPGDEWAAVVGEIAVGGLLGLPFVLLLFPSGRLLSPRWRWALWVAVGAVVTILLGVLLSPSLPDYPDVRNPIGIEALRGTPFDQGGIGWILLLVAVLASATSLVLRFRRARGEERQQLKWLAWSAAFIGIGWIMLSFSFREDGVETATTWLLRLPFYLGFVSLPIVVGIAILKYRLYEIDIVIKKTVVFAILVALLMLVGVVAALAVGGPLIDHASDQPELILLAGVALGLLAIPLYRFSKRIADRLVFRGRASPYEVLRSFAGRVAETYSSDDVLPRMARVLAEATGASRARVWVRVGDGLRVAAGWPMVGAAAPSARLIDGSPPTDLDAHAAEVRDRGELLGVLSVQMPPNDPMNPSKEGLVRDLASQAGLVLRNVRLIEELRESRRRIVAAQDARAKKLERDIHDGAQQQLVALTVKQRLIASLVGKDDERAGVMLDELQHETTDALESLRDLARGIYPPLLADQGLPAALEAQARKAAVPTTVETDAVGRYAQEVEAAIYFCALEALNNVAKYADATRVTISLNQSNGALMFTVADDGRGFDLNRRGGGTGLKGMADRLDAIGGELTIASAPEQGTTVAGRVPAETAR